jgi:NAD(P)-dependent dehydrogenase (short-subunit alcohol dehydrogenase family)
MIPAAEFGQIDALINGAGGNKPDASTDAARTFFDLPEEALRWVFNLNLMGTILPSLIIGCHMAERKEGVILNISSMNALRPLTRIPAYSAAKVGVSNFTQWLAVYIAQEYSPHFRVNALAPGFFLTEQNRFLMTEKETGSLTRRGTQVIGPHPHGPLWNSSGPDRPDVGAAFAGLGLCNRHCCAGGWRFFGFRRRLGCLNSRTPGMLLLALERFYCEGKSDDRFSGSCSSRFLNPADDSRNTSKRSCQ